MLTENQVSAAPTKGISLFELNDNQVTRLKFLAKVLAQSSVNNARNPRKEEDFLLVMLKGLELGFSPMAAIDNISFINGVPTIDAKGLLSLIHASGFLKDMKIEGDATSCTVSMTHSNYPSPFVETFTIQDAQNMGLVDKKGSQYKKQAANMLKWRAISACARIAFPDVLGGLYMTEEIEPDLVMTRDDGSMKYLPEGTTAQLEPPKPEPQAGQPQEDEPDEPEPDIKVVPKNAEEGFLNSEAAKQKLNQWLKDKKLVEGEAYKFILEHYKVAGFGKIAITDEPNFYEELNKLYTAFAEPATPAKKKKKDDKPKETGILRGIETATYDGKRFIFTGYSPNHPNLEVYVWGRTEMKKLVGETYCRENGFLAVIKGEVFEGHFEIEPIEIEYELRTRQTGSESNYGQATKITPRDLDGNPVAPDLDDFIPETTEEEPELEEVIPV